MKVLILTAAKSREYGIPIDVFNMSRAMALRDMGCEVRVIAPIGLTPPMSFIFPVLRVKDLLASWRYYRGIPARETCNGFLVYHPEWYWAPKRLFWGSEVHLLYAFAGRKIQKVLEQFKPDLVITSGVNPFGAYALYLKRSPTMKVFTIMEGSDVLVSPDLYAGWGKIRKIINQFSDVRICVSERMMKDVEALRGIRDTVVIRNGYDGSVFVYKQSPVHADRRECNIISVGNHMHVKGHDILLRAMTMLDSRFSLTLIGRGPLSDEYERYARANGLTHRIRFPGIVAHDSLPGHIRRGDIFCMPSRSEGLPAAPLEAMACGLPVVATEVGGLREIVIDKFNGLLCRPESAQELARAIESAAQLKWDRQRIAEWAREHFTWDRWAKQILAIYESSDGKMPGLASKQNMDYRTAK